MSKDPSSTTSLVLDQDDNDCDDYNDEEKYLGLIKKSFSSTHPRLYTFSIVSAVLIIAGLTTFGICAAWNELSTLLPVLLMTSIAIQP